MAAPVWRRDVLFTWRSVVERHVELFYLVRAPGHAVDTSGLAPAEAREIRAHRWWSVSEILSSQERFAPADLGSRLARLLAEGPPAEPADVGE